MSMRDAQEEVRVVYAALRGNSEDPHAHLRSHMSKAATALGTLKDAERSKWGASGDSAGVVGLLLLVALGLANELEVDSLDALKATLLAESP